MLRILATLAITVAFIALVYSDSLAEQKCCPPDPKQTVNLTINWKRKETGKWVMMFTARGGAEEMAEGMTMNVSRTVLKCDGEDVVQIHGVIGGDTGQSGLEVAELHLTKEGPRVAELRPKQEGPQVAVLNPRKEGPQLPEHHPRIEVPVAEELHPKIDTPEEEEPSEDEPFQFYEKTGDNIKLSNFGRTASRMKAGKVIGGGSLITNRALKDGEMFEVRLERKVTKWGRSISIGVTTEAPRDVVFLDHWYWKKSGVWIYFLHNIFNDGKDIRPHFGVNLEMLERGDRLGVMRKIDGTLHFFVNGNDLGRIQINITGAVYGVMDLYGNAIQATILQP